jgi:predicted nucleic acid-binding protein
MEDITKEKQQEIIEAVESVDGISVSSISIAEYVRGDPTTEDATTTGAEIETTAYLNLDGEPGDDDNPFRVK